MACPSACNQLPGQPKKTSCTGGQVYDEFLWLDGDKTDIMKAGTSNVVTDTDGWMLRDVWRHIRFNWGYPAAQ